MIMFVTNQYAVVHRYKDDLTTCPQATRQPQHRLVTLNQCLVYGLPACGRCWSHEDYVTRVRKGF